MSSNAVRPTWKPFASSMLAEQQLHFSLRLMTGGDSSTTTKKSHKLRADVVQFLKNFDLRQTVWLISPATALIAITQGLADFAVAV